MIWLITGITFLFPLFFFPLITDSFFMAKNFFLAGGVLLILIAGGIFLFREKKKISYSTAVLDFLILLFFLANLVSWFFLPSGAKARSLVQALGLGSIISLTLFYFVLAQIKGREKKESVILGLLFSGTAVSLIWILLFALPGFFPVSLTENLKLIGLNSPVIGFQFLLLASGFSLYLTIKKFKTKKTVNQWWPAVFLVVLLIGVGISGYQSLKTKSVFLDWFSSWATAVETFKRHPFFGIGPGNFNLAFNLYRPIEFNQGNNWNFRFAVPRSWFLQVWAETGLVGLIFLGLIFFHSLRLVRKKEAIWLLAPAWLILLVFPGSLVTLFVLFFSLALVRKGENRREFSLIFGEGGRNGGPLFLGSLLIGFSLFAGYFFCQAFKAEAVFFQGIKAASENRGGDTYNLQFKAIKANRFLSRYRIAFSQTNLALAISLAQKGNDLSEEERQQASQLMAQAVSEAKAGVALEPRNVLGWENLALIYRQLINVAQGADQWVLASYQQTIALDRLNPRLRIDLGGLFYALGQYDEAGKQFEIAISLKQDYANAWYNWAWALKQQGSLEEAVIRLQQAVNLVEVGSPDYEKSFQELEEWKKELGEISGKEEEEPRELIQPEPLPTPRLEEPIELPEEAAPPLEKELESPEETISPTQKP